MKKQTGRGKTGGEVIPLQIDIEEKLIFSGGKGSFFYNIYPCETLNPILIYILNELSLSLSMIKFILVYYSFHGHSKHSVYSFLGGLP